MYLRLGNRARTHQVSVDIQASQIPWSVICSLHYRQLHHHWVRYNHTWQIAYVIKKNLLYCFTYCLSSVPFFFIQTLSLISISFPEIELIFCETFKWMGKLVNCQCCHSHSEQCQKLPTCLPVCIILTWLFSSLITEFRAVAPPVLPLRPLRFVWRRSHYN